MDEHETMDAASIVAPLWRRKWLILMVGVLVAAGTYVYYKRQPSVYKASTQLDLASGAEEQGLLSGNQSRTALSSHAVTDAATLITSNVATESVHALVKKQHLRGQGKVSAKVASASGDFITISAEAPSAKGAAFLANAYVQVYIQRQHTTYQREIEAAIADTRRQLRKLEGTAQRPSGSPARGRHARGGTGTGSGSSATTGSAAVIQAANLGNKINQLETSLSAASVQQVNPATARKAELLSPKPKQNAIFAFVLGVVLAGIAVFALSRLDRRLHSLGGIEAALGSQILTALPSAASPIVSRDGQPAPAEPLLEPLRRLHTTLQLGDMVDHDRQAPRLILFLSADAGDGESTAIAGLAAVQRDAGERVAVIEADLRRPVQAGLLGANNPRGLTEVLTGRISIGEALQRVGPGSRTGGVGSESGVDDSDRIAATGTRSSAQAVAVAAGSSTLAEPVANLIESPAVGSISLLAGGEPAANPPALLASPAMTELLHSLANDFDYVLIDAPSPLQVSDVMPLLGAVDGIVIVARAQHTRTVSAERLVQLLSRSASAPVLGVVANAISRADIERYGFSSAHRRRGWRDRLAL